MSELFRRYGKRPHAIRSEAHAVLAAVPGGLSLCRPFRRIVPALSAGRGRGRPEGRLLVRQLHDVPERRADLPHFRDRSRPSIHAWVFFITIFYSCVVTVFSLLVCYPLSYYLAKVISPKRLASYLLLLVIPMWVSELLRSFSWFIILAFKGPLSFVLQSLGIISRPDPLDLGHGQLQRHHHRPGLFLHPVHAVPALQRDDVAGHQPGSRRRKTWVPNGGRRIGG